MSHTERDTQAEREKLRKHLWVWSAHFWPSPVHWTKLQAQYQKMITPKPEASSSLKRPHEDSSSSSAKRPKSE